MYDEWERSVLVIEMSEMFSMMIDVDVSVCEYDQDSNVAHEYWEVLMNADLFERIDLVLNDVVDW